MKTLDVGLLHGDAHTVTASRGQDVVDVNRIPPGKPSFNARPTDQEGQHLVSCAATSLPRRGR